MPRGGVSDPLLGAGFPRVKCSLCDFVSSPASVVYHEANHHADELEWVPFEGLPDTSPVDGDADGMVKG